MRKAGSLALAAALLGLAAPSRPESGPGTTAAPVLQIPLGSRALGMGTAFTAVASDVSTLFYNPAGLSRLNAHEVSFSFVSGLSDSKLQHFAYGGPLSWSGISGSGYASLGASILAANSGTIEINRTNADGSFLSSETKDAGSDLVLSLGYSERVGTTPLELGARSYGLSHFLGLSGKLVRSTLVEAYTAQTLTGDAGYLLHVPEAGLSFGLSALNLGGGLRYAQEKEPLPTTLRGGLAFTGGVPNVHTLILSADAEHQPREGATYANLGLEYFLQRTYGARLGYQFLRDTLGLTMGLGYRWRARFLIDYAWVMGRELGDSHRITLSYRFGGVAPSARARARRPYIESVPSREQLRDNLERQPETTEPRRPRPLPRDERPGVPGWIY